MVIGLSKRSARSCIPVAGRPQPVLRLPSHTRIGMKEPVSKHRCQAAAGQKELGTSLQVLVASVNPVKVNAATRAIKRCLGGLKDQGLQGTVDLTVSSAQVDSGVPAQPWGDDETLLGARNRVANLRKLHHSSDWKQQYQNHLFVAIEGGLGQGPERERDMESFAWVVIQHAVTGAEGVARSASFVLPRQLTELVKSGMELGAADDKVFGRVASGRGSGTIGRLTHGVLTREEYYEQAVICALAPFLNPDLYGAEYDVLGLLAGHDTQP